MGLAIRVVRPEDPDQPLVFETETLFEEQRLGLRIEFPANFPNGAPQFFGDNEPRLPRHQQESSGLFCLMERESESWHPNDKAAHLAWLLTQRLLTDTAEGADAVARGEADMAEPTSGKLSSALLPQIVVPDPFWESAEPSGKSGFATFRRIERNGEERMLLLTEADGIGPGDEKALSQFQFGSWKYVDGVWLSLPDGEVLVKGGEALLDAISDRQGEIEKQIAASFRGKKRDRRSQPVRVAATFIEEGPTRAETRRAWAYFELKPGAGRPALVAGSIRRVQALSRAARNTRVPDLSGAENASVVVVGAGSLGSPAIEELAKGGIGTMRIYDSDVLEINNSVRHVAPATASGRLKAEYSKTIAEQMNPFGNYSYEITPVGSSSAGDAALADQIALADLVIDTTGNPMVSRTLQDLCADSDVTLIVGGLTSSSYGGDILKITDTGACFDCFAAAEHANPDLKPPEGPKSNATAINCSQPTFFGDGYDATELATNIARLSFQELAQVALEGPDWNLAVLRFRELERLTFAVIEPQAECSICGGEGR